jgi:anti-sigma factor RsiW
MTCQEFVELVTEYLEGELSEARRAELHAHIDECGGCSAYLAQMRATIAALGGLSTENGFESTREQALQAFRELRAPS